MVPRDTTVEAHQVQFAVFAGMTGPERVALAFDLSEKVRAVTRSGIGARHPEYNEQEVSWALYRALYGDELFVKAWPMAPLVAL